MSTVIENFLKKEWNIQKMINISVKKKDSTKAILSLFGYKKYGVKLQI